MAYGLALWTLRSTGFTRAGKTIITASQFALKDGLHKGGWTLSSSTKRRPEILGCAIPMNFGPCKGSPIPRVSKQFPMSVKEVLEECAYALRVLDPATYGQRRRVAQSTVPPYLPK